MRVIAGKFRSRPLVSAAGHNLRPTSDRLRETLFDVLTAGNPSALEGTAWIDLYAGTGAVGIEAISRGSGLVHFVDAAPKAVELIRRNLRSLGVNSGFKVLDMEVVRALRRLQLLDVAADFVFLDPPYELTQEYNQTLNALSVSSLLKPESIVIAEHINKFDPGDAFGTLQRFRLLEQGDSALSFYRRQSDDVVRVSE
ncbi:MAG: 16S rRNA (guanine(966)-N(2))-methyltransferase RsmD [Terriglobales bacterium]|jgi:16S rRNA (guanine(966)-N(2))-methyltransferase RsmD|nr:16S rRNA (guanine(966)-N(2))-methyltransferase RsmD [Terriglobales bacterium]